MSKKDVIVFWDWNGTIVDDCFVFVDILNVLLKENNLPSISIKQYKNNFCFPIDRFYKKINLYKDSAFFDEINLRFAELYKERMFSPSLKKNIISLLSLLHSDGIPQYVVSAQNHKILIKLLEYYGLSKYFVDVFGVNNHVAKGKDVVALNLKNKISNKNNNILFVGDTFLDFEVASKIKATPLLVTWGHYSKKRLAVNANNKHVFDSVYNLKKYFSSL